MMMIANEEKSETTIDFASGAPSILPNEMVREATKGLFTKMAREGVVTRGTAWRHPLQYGTPSGDVGFLKALAAWLSKMYGRDKIPVPPRDLVATAGCSHGLDLALSTIVLTGTSKSQPRLVAFVEDPTYFKAIKTIQDRGFETQLVETDEEGLIPSSLEKSLRREQVNSSRCGVKTAIVVYCVPTFNNPRGGVLSKSRRIEIIEICDRYDVAAIIEDDPYYLIASSERKRPLPPRMTEIRRKQRLSVRSDSASRPRTAVVSLGSFSKLIAPGLRCGWIETTSTSFVKSLGTNSVLSSGGSISHFTSRIVEVLLSRFDGLLLTSHVERIRREYTRRGTLLYDAIRRDLGETLGNVSSLSAVCSVRRPAGGFFLWLTLAKHIDTESLLQNCMATSKGPRVKFRCGPMFSVSRSFRNCVRLSFSKMTDEAILMGSRVLCREIASLFRKGISTVVRESDRQIPAVERPSRSTSRL
eukprot:g3873.t1